MSEPKDAKALAGDIAVSLGVSNDGEQRALSIRCILPHLTPLFERMAGLETLVETLTQDFAGQRRRAEIAESALAEARGEVEQLRATVESDIKWRQRDAAAAEERERILLDESARLRERVEALEGEKAAQSKTFWEIRDAVWEQTADAIEKRNAAEAALATAKKLLAECLSPATGYTGRLERIRAFLASLDSAPAREGEGVKALTPSQELVYTLLRSRLGPNGGGK